MQRLHEHFVYLDEQIKALDKELAGQLAGDDLGRRLLAVEMGDGKQYGCSRDFAASVGFVPRQYSTGGRANLLGISKRGDKNLRRLLVQCARIYMQRLEQQMGPLADWVRSLLMRRHSNVAACALANKLARIACVQDPDKRRGRSGQTGTKPRSAVNGCVLTWGDLALCLKGRRCMLEREAGTLINGVVEKSRCGSQQGGSLSPLLANVLLDEVDRELERRAHYFVRYADDANAYVRSQKAGQRVMNLLKRLYELHLSVNESKNAVTSAFGRKFLGYALRSVRSEVRRADRVPGGRPMQAAPMPMRLT